MNVKKNSPRQKTKILIVEDSRTQAEQLKYILEKHHYKVAVANDGKQALSLFSEHKPALVISDIIMPEMNGYELCKSIKTDFGDEGIPVILLTSLADAEDVLEGLACGADNFITKPYSEDYILSNISQILANRNLRKNERIRIGVEIVFAGKKRFISAEQQQMLTLLISSFEAAVQKNRELTQTQEKLRLMNENLENLVEKRTAALSEEIEKRKRVELKIQTALDALKSSEENFRRSLEDSPLGVRIVTVNGETIYVNKMLLDIYGYENAEELNQIPQKDRYTPQSYAEFKTRKKIRAAGNLGPSVYEINIVRKNKENRHLQVFRKEVFWNGVQQFQVIYQDITERKQAESQREDALIALRENEEKFRKIFEDHAAVKLLIEPESGAIIDANKAAEQYYGWTRAELKRMYIQQINTLPAEQVIVEIKKVQEQKCVNFEFRHRRADGSIRDVEVFSSRIEMAGKDILHSIIHDISERKRAEENIKNSIIEKDVLLKEVHHRVKNNLMIIIGLLKMEETKADSEMFNPLLQELEGRIRSMAQVHESLYKSKDLAHIDLQNYIETMSSQIRAQYGKERDIRLQVQAVGMELGLDVAVPCGLILNELITNAYKHAFPGNRPRSEQGNCEINVIVNQEGSMNVLTVANNGVGLPADLDWEKSETLGLRLVQMLSKQINGSIELDRSAGTAFRLKFSVADKIH
jgi:PAS domain S-box-containing protein